MEINQFFEKKGPFSVKEISDNINCIKIDNFKDLKIHNIRDLFSAKKNDITFFNKTKYKEILLKTQAGACITSLNLSQFLPPKCLKLIVDDVLTAVAKVSKMFYPKADKDYPDQNLKHYSELKHKYKNVSIGQNVLIGKNVKIGEFSSIGSNSIIESNVSIGEKCIIGSFVTVKNSIIESDVYIQDGSKIGIKGFGFISSQTQNLRSPHVGKVILKRGVEIGSGSTIDRGSLSDTIIGDNTFIDNQVHIAHNVKIGKNCIIAGQVGIAGSATLGNSVIIGGQAGISGHLNVGNNVSIGGASGVIRNIPDNTKVMGYPAKPLKDFIKEWNKNDK